MYLSEYNKDIFLNEIKIMEIIEKVRKEENYSKLELGIPTYYFSVL